MPHEPFSNFFPKKAGKETRGLIAPDKNEFGLPMGKYIFMEYYCTDPGCDCRNVIIMVHDVQSQKIQATISYGWEAIEFYRDWMSSDENDDILNDFKGPALKPLMIQSKFANHWLNIFKQMILNDKDYADRLKRHYKLVKNKIDV